ncbi:unnamed protein product [Acanthoscelides obtectus]|nr:unnamed protein product [Acanthoscelides obtectus]CAK1681863.1 SH3 domain-binding glutamic acid-rich protein homolog [Acanthoscelides obtectus]
MILDSKNIKYEIIDIAEPGAEEAKDFMQNNSTALGATIGDPNPRHPLPPQIFNDEAYCGDYDMFDMANEVDEMEKFLKLEPSDAPIAHEPMKNGDVKSEENGKVTNEQNGDTADVQDEGETNNIENEGPVGNKADENGDQTEQTENETSPEKADDE